MQLAGFPHPPAGLPHPPAGLPQPPAGFPQPPAGLPQAYGVAQPNPTVPRMHVRGPRISAWLQYCDRCPGRDGENFYALVDRFDEQGYRTIDQLTGSRMSVENLSNWLKIGKGTADLIIQFAEEDMGLVGDGNFTMDMEPAPEFTGIDNDFF
jgi:hypothetical protein